jgi:hypothetical protein
VDYDAKVRDTNALEHGTQIDSDGATVIHEVLLLPDKGEWYFPSRSNIDHLLSFLADKIKSDTAKAKPAQPDGELRHAQAYSS